MDKLLSTTHYFSRECRKEYKINKPFTNKLYNRRQSDLF